MKLLILNYEYPPLGGGAGVCTKYQAEGLAGLGHEVIVVTTWFIGEKEFECKGNLEVIRLRARRKKSFRSNPLEMLSWAMKAYRYIRREKVYMKADLVLAHFAIPGGLVAFPLKRRFGLPYMIISHGQDIPWFSPRELWFYHTLFYFPIRRICSAASKITVLSAERLRDLNRITPNRKHQNNRIVPNGCDTSFFVPDFSSRDPKCLRIIFVGRLTRQKDPLLMLQAVRTLKTEGISFKVEIIGDGPLRKKMETYVDKNGLATHVDFTGWLSKSELLKKYQHAHLLIVTSRDEGMSLAMMEALSSGVYVITTRVSGSEHLIREGKNGDFVPFGDVRELVSAVRNYDQDKFRNQFRMAPGILDEVRQQTGWENYINTYHQLVQE